MTSGGARQAASRGSTYFHGTFGDHNDSYLGGLADHDASGFVDGRGGTQVHQEQYSQETRNTIISNGSTPSNDALSGYGGVLEGDEARDVEMSSSTPPGFVVQTHLYSNGYDQSMWIEDEAYLLRRGQLNDQSLRELPFPVPDNSPEDVIAASPPSTTDTVMNNHGSPG
jgi:hypothetical protein